MAVAIASVIATGTLFATPTTVHTIYWRATGTAGTIVLRDGGAGGTIKATVNTPAAVSAGSIPVGGGGVQFATDVHATLTNADACLIVHS